jgi:hypothetical protein
MAVAQNGGRLRITSEGDAVSQTAPTVELDPRDVPGWAATPYETLFTLAREDT